MMTLSVGPAPVKVTTRVKATVTRFHCGHIAPLANPSFGLGVSPIDLAALIADGQVDAEPTDSQWDAMALESQMSDAIDRGIVECSLEPLTAIEAAPAVVVTDMEPGRVGKFNDMIADWSMANWPADDNDSAAWEKFQADRLAEEIRLREMIWPQSRKPSKPAPVTRPRPISKPKRRRPAAPLISEETRIILIAHREKMLGRGFDEAEMGDWHSTETLRQSRRQLAGV